MKVVVGIDEAGRGPLAGPVVAVAFAAPRFALRNLARSSLPLRDSKKLSERQREGWYRVLSLCLELKWGVGEVSEKLIDRMNILEATKLAMSKALTRLESKLGIDEEIAQVTVDGNFVIPTGYLCRSLVKADERVVECMAASIIAKVHRDRIMRRYDTKYPGYGFAQHKGYGTSFHQEKIQELGPCLIHRMSFAPLRERGE